MLVKYIRIKLSEINLGFVAKKSIFFSIFAGYGNYYRRYSLTNFRSKLIPSQFQF